MSEREKCKCGGECENVQHCDDVLQCEQCGAQFLASSEEQGNTSPPDDDYSLESGDENM